MSSKLPARLYYDIISPFAYLYIKQRKRPEEKLELRLCRSCWVAFLGQLRTKGLVKLPLSALIPINFAFGKPRG